MIKNALLLITFLYTLVLCSSLATAATKTVFLGKTFCSDNNIVCIKGSIAVDYQRHIMALKGRNQHSHPPGKLSLKLKANTNQSRPITLKLTGHLTGQYSALIHFEKSFKKIKKLQPYGTKWTLYDISFKPDK